jgi:Ribbon-helix-helix protein, copG family
MAKKPALSWSFCAFVLTCLTWMRTKFPTLTSSTSVLTCPDGGLFVVISCLVHEVCSRTVTLGRWWRRRWTVPRTCKNPQRMVLPGYTDAVKTAISVPDDTFEQATKQAAELGISRSEFFARAARRYLDELASRSLTQQVNDALQAAGDDDSAAAAAHAGRELLATGQDW